MKGTSPSQVSREPLGLRSTATERHDGEVKLVINSPENGIHDHRNCWMWPHKELLWRSWHQYNSNPVDRWVGLCVRIAASDLEFNRSKLESCDSTPDFFSGLRGKSTET